MWIDAVRTLLQVFLFPESCVVCQGWVANCDFSPLCVPCGGNVPQLKAPRCERCGIPVPGSVQEPVPLCSSCRRCTNPIDRARAYGPFEGSLAHIIRSYKFENRRRLSAPLSRFLVSTFESEFRNLEPDWIVPVPQHPDRVRERGFDHIGLLARAVSKELRTPLFPTLHRVRPTRPQVGLSLAERRKNLHNAFNGSHLSQLRGSRILILDDVMTTGATVQEISRLLRNQGAPAFIGVITIARACRKFV